MRFFSALLLLFFAVSLFGFAQQPVYEAFEVDSAAHVPGGMGNLALFLRTNLRPPLAMQATGVSGRVFVQAVVGRDGRVGELSVLRTLRPDADREALRVVGLFNAWQPAWKGSQPVGQKVVVPVEFRIPPAAWTYENGRKIELFNADEQPTTDEKRAAFRLVTPVDSLGNPTGDAEIFRLDAPKKPFAVNRFAKIGVWQPGGPPVASPDSIRFFRFVLTNPEGLPNGTVRHDYATGELRALETFGRGEPVGASRHFHRNGVVSELTIHLDPNSSHTLRWFANGQIRDDFSEKRAGFAFQRTLANAWASDGRVLVANGAGTVRDTTEVGTALLVEEGAYRDGRKHGRWTGAFTSGRRFYEENYEVGTLTSGQSYDEAGQPIRYTVAEQPPEFKGGQPALNAFLTNNLTYPLEAQRSRVSGRVMVSFVVETDGTITDVVALNRPGYGLEKEAIRVVKKMSGRWTPGIQRGRPVKARFNLPLTFNLN